MEVEANVKPTWSLRGTVGRLDIDELTGEVDIARPCAGVRNLIIGGERTTHALLKVSRGDAAARNWPLAVSDAYIRGNDLVATYQPAGDWPYSPQVYWQADTLATIDGVRGSLALLVSVQTHLLDTWPEIIVASEVASTDVLRMSLAATGRANIEPVTGNQRISAAAGACCIIRRLGGLPLSYLEVMPGTDFQEVAISPQQNGTSITEWQLFDDFLEKGVIRRARLQAAFVPTANDVELADACYRALEEKPLPLTT